MVSVDGAQTWSTWYNQPTAQIYHLAASNDFPYHLYGAQQDSGGVGVDTWSPFGMLSFRDWEPTCLAGESNTVVPDPDPTRARVLYGGASACDQSLNIALQGGELPPADPANANRKTWTLPEVFSPADQALYYSNQFVFRSRDRGKTWQKISPDLSRLHPEMPKNLDPVTATDIDQPMTERFGVVYTISPSPLDAKTVWVGTDDGLLQTTKDDGGSWQNVTPPSMAAWSKVSQVEAGHFDLATAYASIDRHRLGDMKPYILRTHDGGKTWQEATRGIPEGAYVNSVKEDTKQKGLLYAATELRVYVSFDDGGHWQTLQQNMPVTSVRDLVVHGDDLAVATYGRGFWVLDSMASLRQIAADGRTIEAGKSHLFAPGETFALRQGGHERDAAASRRAAGAESTQWSGGVLLAQISGDDAVEDRTGGCKRQHARVPGQRYAGEARRHGVDQRPGDLGVAATASLDRCRHTPGVAGYAADARFWWRRAAAFLSTAACGRMPPGALAGGQQPASCRAHATPAARGRGSASGQLHRAFDGER